MCTYPAAMHDITLQRHDVCVFLYGGGVAKSNADQLSGELHGGKAVQVLAVVTLAGKSLRQSGAQNPPTPQRAKSATKEEPVTDSTRPAKRAGVQCTDKARADDTARSVCAGVHRDESEGKCINCFLPTQSLRPTKFLVVRKSGFFEFGFFVKIFEKIF